jgi:hypothetical protein
VTPSLSLRGREPLSIGLRRESPIRTTRVPPQNVCSRADRERTHKLPPTLPQGVSLLPFTHLRPVCQQLSSNHCHVHSIPSFSHITTPPFPLLLKPLSERSVFPLSLRRSTAPVLSSSCSSNYPPSSRRRPFTLLIKLIIGETDAGEHRPGWMRVLAMGIMRG